MNRRTLLKGVVLAAGAVSIPKAIFPLSEREGRRASWIRMYLLDADKKPVLGFADITMEPRDERMVSTAFGVFGTASMAADEVVTPRWIAVPRLHLLTPMPNPPSLLRGDTIEITYDLEGTIAEGMTLSGAEFTRRAMFTREVDITDFVDEVKTGFVEPGEGYPEDMEMYAPIGPDEVDEERDW